MFCLFVVLFNFYICFSMFCFLSFPRDSNVFIQLDEVFER